MGNTEKKNVGKKTKVGIGATIAAFVVGGATYLLCKAKKNKAEAETEEFTSDTVIDDIPGTEE